MPQKLYISLIILAFSFSGAAQVNKASQGLRNPISIKTIPSSLYAQQLSIVCKGEMLLQKKTGLPIFFRLGSKEYVDYLEQKPNAMRRW